MRKQIILLLVLNLCSQGLSFAEEKSGIGDKIISSSFKTLAKTFIVAADINKLKENNIAKLNTMEDDKFKKRYAGVYKIMKELPPKLKAAYGITEEINKEQAIEKIRSLDKKMIYEIIDSIPDEIIARQFQQYLNAEKQEIRKANIIEQINKFWNKIITRV